MPRFVNVQDSFSSGELGPFVKGRLNTEQYRSGVQEMLNFLPTKEGPTIRRPGSTYLGQFEHLPNLYQPNFVIAAADITIATDLFANVANPTQTGEKVRVTTSNTLPAPLVVNTDYYVIYVSDTTIKLASSLTLALAGTPINITSQGIGNHTFALQAQSVTDVHLIPYQTSATNGYIVAILKLETKIVAQFYTYVGAIFSAAFTASTSAIIGWSYWNDGSGPEGLLPFEEDIHDFSYAQTGDNLFLCHSSAKIPPILIRIRSLLGTNQFSINHLYDAYRIEGITLADTSEANKAAVDISVMNPILYRAYTDINSTQVTLTPGAAAIPGAATTLTASSALFYAGMEKSYIKRTVSSSTYAYKITSIVSSTVANVTYIGPVNPSDTSASKLWEFQKWNYFWGHPRCVTLFEQRLLFVSTLKAPDTHDFSAIGNIFLFMSKKLAQDLTSDGSALNYFGSVIDSDPFSLRPAADQLNLIQWVASSRNLYSGSSSTEYSISGVTKAITPTNFQIRPESEAGSTYVQPGKISNSLIFVGKDGKQLRQLKYTEQQGLSLPKDLTLQFGKWENDYYTTAPSNLKIKQLAYNRSRETIFALYRNTATSASFIKAIMIHDMADALGAATIDIAGTTRDILSIICLPNVDTFKDNLVMCIKRTIAGTAYFTLEELHDDFDKTTLTNTENASFATQVAYNPVYVDCGALRSGVASNSLHHPILKSVNVDVLADGISYEDIALDANGDGVLPLSATASNFIIGLPFTSRLKLLPLNSGGAGNNDGLASVKSIDKFWIQYRNSKHLEYGTESGSLYSLEIDTALTTADLYSGVKSKAAPSNSDFLKNIIISTDKPFPCTILQVGYRGVTEEV